MEAAFVGFTRPAAEAFARHGVGRVVAVSALGRSTPWAGRAGYVTGSLAMDDLIAASGVSYRALTNPSFMDNTARQAESIKNQGMFFSPIAGDRKLPTVATRDIAAAAARLLLDADWSGVGEVPLLGPEDLSFNDMAGIMSEVLGKDVRFQQTTFEAYKERFVSFGMSDAMAQGMTDMAWAKNEGLDNGVQRTPENSTPTSFRQWCERGPEASGAPPRRHAMPTPLQTSRRTSRAGDRRRPRDRPGRSPSVSPSAGPRRPRGPRRRDADARSHR